MPSRLHMPALAGALALCAAAATAQQPVTQPPGTTGAWGTDVRPSPPPLLKGTTTDPGLPANTTVVPRPAPGGEQRIGGQITLTAHLSEESSPIEQGLVWRIFRDKPGPDGKMRLLSQHRDAAPQLRLDIGDYRIQAAYGRAHLTRRITISPGKAIAEKFVINAGGLKVLAVLPTGEPVPENTVAYTVLSDERDQFGNRMPVAGSIRPGIVLRLNAGLYQLHSVYGDANASVRGEVAVEPGKITEATLTHAVARATFKLVARAGGDALADTQWTVVGGGGETIKESAGAFPSHHFAPGNYAVVAKRLGQSFRRDFELKAGEVVTIEVVAHAQP